MTYKRRYDEWEDEADAIFREAARRDGYLEPDGPGLWAWYRENGILPPEWFRKVLTKHEITGLADDTPTPEENE